MRGAARQKSLDSPQFEVRNLQRIDRGRRIIACLDFVLRGVTLRKSRLIDGISGVYACGPALRARSDAWAATLAELESDLALEVQAAVEAQLAAGAS